VLDEFARGDILLADRHFCGLFTIALLLQRKCDCLTWLYQCRETDSPIVSNPALESGVPNLIARTNGTQRSATEGYPTTENDLGVFILESATFRLLTTCYAI
jgi:hypothetical protein